MALTFSKLFPPTMLTAVAATIYTMPGAPSTTVLRNGRVLLTNTDTVAHAVTLYAVPASGAASATNQILPAMVVAANGTLPVDLPQMAINDFLQGFADLTNKVNIQALDGVLQS